MPSSSLELAVVIVNYRTPGLVIDCLASLEEQLSKSPGRLAVIVDSASGDESVREIEGAAADRGWRHWVSVIPASRNGGFSAGYNLGMQSVQARAYLLLNSDTVVRPGAVDSLLSVLKTRPNAGIVGPRLEWLNGERQDSCFRYRSPASELIRSARTGPVTRLLRRFDVPLSDVENGTAMWVSFAAVLIRAETLARVGFLDEGFFMFFEDIDYCRRAHRDGWEVCFEPRARIVHLRGRSSTVKKALRSRARPPSYYYASRNRYFAKFYGGTAGVLLANAMWTVGRAVSLLREGFGRKEPHLCEAEYRDNWVNWRTPLRPPHAIRDDDS